MLKLCEAEGIGVIPWSPLARGRLTRPWGSAGTTSRNETDKYGRSLFEKVEEADKKVVERVQEISGKRNVPMSQIGLAWLLQKPVVTAPIIGATKMSHLEDAVAALSLKLSDDEIKSLEEPYVPHAVAGWV